MGLHDLGRVLEKCLQVINVAGIARHNAGQWWESCVLQNGVGGWVFLFKVEVDLPVYGLGLGLYGRSGLFDQLQGLEVNAHRRSLVTVAVQVRSSSPCR